MKALSSKLILVTAMTGGLALAGCTTAPYGNNGNYDRGYQSQSNGYGDRNVRCQTCGVVQDVQQVRVEGSGNGGTLGAIIGAVAGGVLGNQVGKGDGRKAATVAGAVVGGAVGHNVASQDDRYYAGPERRCRRVQDNAEERRIVGYDVQYRYRGDVYMSRLDYDPGERVRVRVSVAPAE